MMKEMYPKNGRVILHVDMNSFYASVEAAYNPSLKNKPLAIAGSVEERRGIIITCSYEARAQGVKTTMPLWEARKLCPDLIVMKPNFERYRKASLAIFDLLGTYTSFVEPVSIDEGYLDITECYRLGAPYEIAKDIQSRIWNELMLPCSIGLAPNKFLAKMASNMKKPFGITILRKRDVESILWPLPVIEMHGVGAKTAEKLQKINVYTIGQLAKANKDQLTMLLGINGERLKQRANGIDSRQVDPEAITEFKSIGNSTTLPFDSSRIAELLEVISKLANSVSRRLKHKGMLANNVQLMIRYHDRKTITRTDRPTNPTNQKEELFQAASTLFQRHWNQEPVRLLGVTAFDLVEKDEAVKQLDLFSYEEDVKKEPLLQVINQLKEKFGKKIVTQGIVLNENSTYPDKEQGTSFEKDFLRDVNKKKE